MGSRCFVIGEICKDVGGHSRFSRFIFIKASSSPGRRHLKPVNLWSRGSGQDHVPGSLSFKFESTFGILRISTRSEGGNGRTWSI